MYRAVTWHTLESGVDPANAESRGAADRAANIESGFDAEGRVVLATWAEMDPEPYLRDAGINAHVFGGGQRAWRCVRC